MNALIILFYRIAALFTRVAAKSKAFQTNTRAEKLSQPENQFSSFINYQANFSNIPYGKGDLGLNGCGPIALFNAITNLNSTNSHKDFSFSSVVDYLETRGAAFGGRLGTAPQVINKYLKTLGYETGTLISKNQRKLNGFSDQFDTFISLIFNDSKSLKKGLHFICTCKDEHGLFTSHNPERTGDSLFGALNACSDDEIRHVYTIGIKRKVNI